MSEIVIVHGPPGSGKTTHAKELSDTRIDIGHISAGVLIRDIRSGVKRSIFETEIISHAQDNKDATPLKNEIVNAIVLEQLALFSGAQTVLVDGFPSFIDSCRIFMQSIEKRGDTIAGCINLTVSEETSISRQLERGKRKSEKGGENMNEEVFAKKRYQKHIVNTIPVINILRESCKIVEIDANLDKEIVWSLFLIGFMELTKSVS